MAHHPEKFLDGRMLWHGRIYSPLPFVRSLWGERINAGVWGTAAFPSVYRTDVHPFAFLPHSVKWQVLSLVLALAGADRRPDRRACVGGRPAARRRRRRHCRDDREERFLRAAIRRRFAAGQPAVVSRWRSRTCISSSRSRESAGQIRGILSPPEVALPVAQRQTSRGPRLVPRGDRRALLLLSGSVTEDRYWSETWTSADRVLTQLTDWLRRSRAVRDHRDRRRLVATIATSACWSGRWAWLDVRALVEEHGGGKRLLRVSTHLRPTTPGRRQRRGARRRACSRRRSPASPCAGRSPGVAAALAPRPSPRSSRGARPRRRRFCTAASKRSTQRLGMTPLEVGAGARAARRAVGAARLRAAQRGAVRRHDSRARRQHVHAARGRHGAGDRRAQGLRRRQRPGDRGLRSTRPAASPWRRTATSTSPTRTTTSSGASTRATTSPPSSATTRAARHSPATSARPPPAQLDTPERRRRSRPTATWSSPTRTTTGSAASIATTGVIITIAGSGESGYDGDDKPATEAALNAPSAVAAAPNGDIYIADTLNYRVRMIDHATGFIHTIAGDGEPGDDGTVGDGGPATARRPQHAERRRDRAERRHLHRRHAPSARAPHRRADAHHHDGRRQRPVGQHRRRRPARRDASLAGPAGHGGRPDEAGRRDPVHRRLLQRPRARRRRPTASSATSATTAAMTFGAPTRVAYRADGAAGSRSPTPAAIGSSRSTSDSRRPRRRRRRGAPRRPTQARRRGRMSAPAAREPLAARLDAVVPPSVPARASLLLSVLLLVRSRSARCSRGRSRSSSTTSSARSAASRAVARLAAGDHRRQPGRRCWSLIVVAGVLLQVVNQFVTAYATQVQVDTGQRMVYDLRYRLFQHLQALGLHHHITTNTGDAVYRVDVDAYAIENLVMSGILPLATSVDHAGGDVRHPAHGSTSPWRCCRWRSCRSCSCCLRYYMRTLSTRRSGSRSSSRSSSSGSTKCSRRSGWSRASRASRTRPTRYTDAGDEDDAGAHRDHVAGVAVLAWSWRRSPFSARRWS